MIILGFSIKKICSTLIGNVTQTRKSYMEWRKQQRSNKELAKAARKNQIVIDINDVKDEHEACGALFAEIQNAADLYGIFEDLFDGAYFTPALSLSVEYDFDEEYITPVYRGNVIKPKEAQKRPQVHWPSKDDSLWTLVMTNPDGHFSETNAEYLHWMVSNVKGSDLSQGSVNVPYLQPFPAFGTGFHRYVFILFKQSSPVDLSKFNESGPVSLKGRTFRTSQFFNEYKDQLTPAGLAFFQSDWDSSLTQVFHHVLNMKEPRFEYDFAPPYTAPWLEKNPRQ